MIIHELVSVVRNILVHCVVLSGLVCVVDHFNALPLLHDPGDCEAHLGPFVL